MKDDIEKDDKLLFKTRRMVFVAKHLSENFNSLTEALKTQENKDHLDLVKKAEAQLSEELEKYFYNEMPTPIITFDPEIKVHPVGEMIIAPTPKDFKPKKTVTVSKPTGNAPITGFSSTPAGKKFITKDKA